MRSDKNMRWCMGRRQQECMPATAQQNHHPVKASHLSTPECLIKRKIVIRMEYKAISTEMEKKGWVQADVRPGRVSYRQRGCAQRCTGPEAPRAPRPTGLLCAHLRSSPNFYGEDGSGIHHYSGCSLYRKLIGERPPGSVAERSCGGRFACRGHSPAAVDPSSGEQSRDGWYPIGP